MDDAIPFTTHNSSACCIVELEDLQLLDNLISTAVDHVG